MQVYKLALLLFLVGCGGGVVEHVKESASEIKTHAGSIKGFALSSIQIAKLVSVNHPKTKPQMDKIISLQDETIKRSLLIYEQADYIDKQINDLDEMIDWFKLIFLLGMGFGGIIIGYLSFEVGKWKTTVFGAVMCFGAVSMNFYWHLIETAFLPIIGGGFAIILCFMYVHYVDEKRRTTQEVLNNTPTELP